MASAAGFGSGDSAAVLGQPLDFVVQVRLEAGETLSAPCVSAEVTAGDHQIPPSQVRALVEWQGAESARIRVLTLQGIDEPVVGVNLTAGCVSRVSRRYVLLADPPAIPTSALPVVAALPQETALPAAALEAPRPPLEASPAADARAVAAHPAVAPRAAAVRPASRTAAAALGRAPPRPPPPAARTRKLVPQAEPPARLKLDLMEPGARPESAVVEQAIDAVAQAASAAREAASAASAASERITTLERTVEQLRGEAKANRDLAAELRERLAQNEGPSRWMLPLLVTTAILAALAAWLAWRLGSLQNDRKRSWQAAVPPPPRARPRVPQAAAEPGPSRQPTSPIPFVTSEIVLPGPPPASAAAPRSAPARPAAPAPAPAPAAEPRMLSAAAPERGDDTLAQRTEVLPPSARAEDGPPRDVSIEELIDLEQQAEFFVVLGQDEAAIDLLVEHLRSTGGGSPLPYLKLLEIHHRRGDRAAYERMRTRFNHRFNAYAPDWGADLQSGRSLEDYAGVVPRLQQVWARPIDAMAELEALLFRKSRGEMFDLPAYREVLFLYSLARDLMDREAVESGNVDLLLPLADGSEFSTTTPAPFLGLERHAAGGGHDFDDRPTSPVDFDPSEPEPPTSLFDPLDDVPPRRR